MCSLVTLVVTRARECDWLASLQSTVLDEINALFSWNPPLLTYSKQEDIFSSQATRRPSFFDKHFSPQLVLKRVVRLPSLVQDLAKAADSALEEAKDTLPSGSSFITAREREKWVAHLETFMEKESAVASFYGRTTGLFCPFVASTLALHPTASFSEWTTLLHWTQAVSTSLTSGYAIADGELTFRRVDLSTTKGQLLQKIVETMDRNKRRVYEQMRDSRSPLTMYEVKSLSAGPDEVMDAVTNLDDFTWVYCDIRSHCNIAKHKQGMKMGAQIVTGPDAVHPPWDISDSKLRYEKTQRAPPPFASHPGFTQEGHDDEDPYAAQRSTPPAPMALSFVPLSSQFQFPPLQSTSKKRKRPDDDATYTHTHTSSPPTPLSSDEPSLKGKNRQKNDDDSDNKAADKCDAAYQDCHDISAASLAQQAWAQAVRVDTSIIVLHSGNHELVCIRHRKSQTLYVSDVIEPHSCANPAYGKLHVGIGIAAFQDAVDRKQQQVTPANSGQGSGSGLGSGLGGDEHRGGRGRGGGGRGKGGSRGVKGRGKGPTEDELAVEKMLHTARRCDIILLYLQYDVYDSPVPASFVRSLPPIMSMPPRCPSPPFSPPNRTYRQNDCLTIVATSEIGRGATGVALRGTLTPDNLDNPPLDIVVKLAFDSGQRDSLRDEYEVYLHLKSEGVHHGITTVLGFFDDLDGSACALVMLYAGVPISTDSGRDLTFTERYLALSRLESIHNAGIVHGDIRPDNILVDDLGVTIIDFGHATRSNNQKVKDGEYACLRSILGLVGES